jgi:uncharacterized protein (TIGR02266 family)
VAAQDTRVGDRQPTSMRIKLKYPDIETFIQKYAMNISRGGIFIATKTPKPVGTNLRFEFLLANEAGTSVIRGDGQVQWTREFDPAAPTKAHGMGIKFTRLDPESQSVVERALAWRAAQGAKRDEAGAPSPIEPAPRSRVDETKPVEVPDEPSPLRPRDQETRPIPVEEVVRPSAPAAPPSPPPRPRVVAPPEPVVKLSLEHDPSRDIRIRGSLRGVTELADLDRLAAEWGISEERLQRVLKRRRPRMVEATAELERLVRKPSRTPPPTKAEALAGLRALLERSSPVVEIDIDPPRLGRPREESRAREEREAHAAGGESEPANKRRIG